MIKKTYMYFLSNNIIILLSVIILFFMTDYCIIILCVSEYTEYSQRIKLRIVFFVSFLILFYGMTILYFYLL